MYNPAQQEGPAPSTARPGSANLQTPGWEGDPRGLAGTDDEAGFQARSPQDWGVQAPPRGEHGHCPSRPLNWGGVHAGHEGEAPLTQSEGGVHPPRTGSVQAGTPGFHRKQLLAATKHLQLLLRKEKKIRGWVRSDRGGTSCLKGLRLPCKAQGPPLHIQSWGHVGPLEPTKAGGLGAQGTKGNK